MRAYVESGKVGNDCQRAKESVKAGRPDEMNGTCVQKSVEQVEGAGILNKIMKINIEYYHIFVCFIHAMFKSESL